MRSERILQMERDSRLNRHIGVAETELDGLTSPLPREPRDGVAQADLHRSAEQLARLWRELESLKARTPRHTTATCVS